MKKPAVTDTQETDADDLLNEFEKLYWMSVEKEAQNMIEFYAELCSSSDLVLQPRIDLESCCKSFKRIFEVWVGCQPGPSDDSVSDLYAETTKAARDHFTKSTSKQEWAARLILQTSGLLDVDVLYEPTDGSQRYVRGQQNQPNVEQVEVLEKDRGVVTIVRGITCAQCERLIKSPTFYECREDCQARCFYGIDELSGSVAFHGPDEAESDSYPPFRLCSVCMSQAGPGDLYDSGCGHEHLDEVMYNQTHIDDLDAIRSQLTKAEIHRQRETELSKPTDSEPEVKRSRPRKMKFIEKALEQTDGLWPTDPRLFMRTVGLMIKGHYAPSGNFHLSLMFGPLIFESGLGGTNHGVLISPRPPPALFSDGGFGDVDDQWKMEKRLVFYWHKKKKTAHRGLTKFDPPFRPRPTLACLKRVYGAAFSGYPKPRQTCEASVVQRLMELGGSYIRLPGDKPSLERRTALKELARKLRDSLESCIGEEVRKHLSRIANILVQRKDRGQWSLLMNNCQLLVNLLLSGLDFEYAVPLCPKNLREDNFGWPRYLMSFGNHIEGFGKSLYQPNCLITQYNQSKPTVDYDLIEYIGRCASSPSPSHSKDLASLCFFPSSSSSSSSSSTTSLLSLKLLDTLWLLPGDSLSLLQFHLFRSPHKYHLDQDAWLRNRLSVMHLFDVMATFMGALGNALSDRLLAGGRDLLSRITIPPARIIGNVRADKKLRILGGLGPRWTVYDIVHRTPNAMKDVVENPTRFWTASRTEDDPIHGEEVVSRIVGWFVAPIAAVSPFAAAAIGGSFRLHENFWVAVNVGQHTYVRQYLWKRMEKVRDVGG